LCHRIETELRVSSEYVRFTRLPVLIRSTDRPTCSYGSTSKRYGRELHWRKYIIHFHAPIRILITNSIQVYTFSALTIFFTLASPRKPGDLLLVGENGMADWLFLVKGTSFIVNNYEEFLRQGLLGPMFISGSRQSALRTQYIAEKSPQDDPLVELSGLIAQNSTDERNKHIYLAAIETLRKSFAFYDRPGPPGYETGDVFIWIFEVTEEFLQLLREHTQESLTIFSYFCVVLKRLDSHWWMQGWSSHIISKIWNLLDEEHRYEISPSVL